MVPGGVIRLAAGEQALIFKDVYRRVFRRAATWMVNVDSEIRRANAAAAGEMDGTPAEADTPPATEDAAPADAPAWTHLYKGLRACVVGAEGAEDGERVLVAIEGGPNRSMKRETWEAKAQSLPESDAQENVDDATL